MQAGKPDLFANWPLALFQSINALLALVAALPFLARSKDRA
jgi:hypothetical protein